MGLVCNTESSIIPLHATFLKESYIPYVCLLPCLCLKGNGHYGEGVFKVHVVCPAGTAPHEAAAGLCGLCGCQPFP